MNEYEIDNCGSGKLYRWKRVLHLGGKVSIWILASPWADPSA